MPTFTRPVVRLGIGIGIIVAAYGVAAVALGCFSTVPASPGAQPIVEEMPPAQPVIAELPKECAGLPVLSGVVSEKDTGTANHGGQRVPGWVQASSFISTARGASSLFSSDPQSYWHIDLRKNLPVEWAVFDLGPGPETAIGGVQVRPRSDAPAQLFTTACLLGSGDRDSWTGIARLDAAPASTPRWVSWQFATPQDYRYYRLVIPNADHKFYSVGKLRFVPKGNS